MVVEKNGTVSTEPASWPAKSSTYCSARSIKFVLSRTYSLKDWDTDSRGLENEVVDSAWPKRTN